MNKSKSDYRNQLKDLMIYIKMPNKKVAMILKIDIKPVDEFFDKANDEALTEEQLIYLLRVLQRTKDLNEKRIAKGLEFLNK